MKYPLSVLFLAGGISAAGVVYMPIELPFGAGAKISTGLVIGTNSTPIPIVLDFGSSDFWVFTDPNNINYGSPYLGAIGQCNTESPYFFNPAGSASASKPIPFVATYSYGGNSKILKAATAANDTLSFPPALSPSRIPNVEMALVNSVTTSIPEDGTNCLPITYDYGILGLSARSPTSTGPFFRAGLLERGTVASTVQSMWMDAPPADADARVKFTGGTLTGGVDKSKFTGKLVTLPIVTAPADVGYYIAQPVVIASGKTLRGDYPGNCLVDSGSLQLTIPFQYDSKTFFAATGLLNDHGAAVYPKPCAVIPRDVTLDLSFTSKQGTVAVQIPMWKLARGATSYNGNKDYCALQLNLTNACVLGAPFFTSAFVVVDDEEAVVGLAQGGVSIAGADYDQSSLVLGPVKAGLVGTGKAS